MNSSLTALQSALSDSTSIATFLSHLQVPLAMVDENLNIQFSNRAFTMCVGRLVRRKQTCLTNVFEQGVETFQTMIEQVRQQEHVVGDETKFYTYDGNVFVARPFITKIQNQDANSYLLVLQEVTDEVRLFENFQKNLKHLEEQLVFFQILDQASCLFQSINEEQDLIEAIVQFVIENFDCQACVFFQKSDNLSLQKYQIIAQFPLQLEGALQQEVENIQVNSNFGLEITDFAKGRLFPITKNDESCQDYLYVVFQNVDQESSVDQNFNLFIKSLYPCLENCRVIEGLENLAIQRSHEWCELQGELSEMIPLATVGETVSLLTQELLNPMTSMLFRLETLQSSQGVVELSTLILEAWDQEFQQGGIDALLKVLFEPSKEQLLWEEDLNSLKYCSNKLQKNLETVTDQFKQIISMLHEMRHASKQVEAPQPFDVSHAITKMYQLIAFQMESKEIQWELTGETAYAVGHENEFIQTLLCLCRNSIHAIGRSGWIQASIQKVDQEIHVTITDSGSGVAPEMQEQIFQFELTNKDSQGAKGLGLNLSRRFMRRASGDLELIDIGGKTHGAVFRCRLPQFKES